MLKVELTNNSEKFLKKCEKGLKGRVIKKIKSLSKNPYPSSCVKIRGEKNIFRVRVGDYRILYSVFKETLLVYKIDKRSKIYD